MSDRMSSTTRSSSGRTLEKPIYVEGSAVQHNSISNSEKNEFIPNPMISTSNLDEEYDIVLSRYFGGNMSTNTLNFDQKNLMTYRQQESLEPESFWLRFRI